MSAFQGPKVYGAVTVGERGQVVIPADLRSTFKIKSGDKLIVFAKQGEMIGLIQANRLNDFLSHMSQVMAAVEKIKPSVK